MNILKLIIIGFLFIFFTASKSVAQSIFIGWGPVHSHTKQTQRLVNGKDAFFYGYTQKIVGFEYLYKNFSGLFSISNYPASTLIRVNADNFIGFTGTKVT